MLHNLIRGEKMYSNSNFNNLKLSSSMESYLEMISRIQQYNDDVRIGHLAKSLNVRASSASKMVTNLKNLGFVTFEKYGSIKLTKKGMIHGNYLLHRHEVLNNFLTFINSTPNELEQVEKIEHYIDQRTLNNIEKFLERCRPLS